MKKVILSLMTATLLFSGVVTVAAQQSGELIQPMRVPAALEATAQAQASGSASVVIRETRQLIQERKDQDVTETAGSKMEQLTTHLLEQPETPLSWNNFISHFVRGAVNRGLPSTLLALLILFPLVSSVIAFSRHVVGLRGFGIYTPAVLSVALASTGIPIGILCFVMIVFVSVLLQKLMKKLNLAHLPKTSLILWGVCVSVIAFLILSSYGGFTSFFSLSIFPLLTLISLSENFTSTQLISSTKEAVRLTVETLILAVVAAVIINSDNVQRFAIVYPGWTLVFTLVIDLLIGRYNGLRLMELFRFKALVKKE